MREASTEITGLAFPDEMFAHEGHSRLRYQGRAAAAGGTNAGGTTRMIDKTPGHASAEEWLTWPGAMVWRRTFPGRADQIRCARNFAASLFEGSKRQEDIRELVSELAANAVVHTRSGRPGGWFGLEVITDKLARIAIRDLGGAGAPNVRTEPLAGSELRVSGRGLFLVRAKAVGIGVHGCPAHGHTVWVDIDLNTEPEAGTEALLGAW